MLFRFLYERETSRNKHLSQITPAPSLAFVHSEQFICLQKRCTANHAACCVGLFVHLPPPAGGYRGGYRGGIYCTLYLYLYLYLYLGHWHIPWQSHWQTYGNPMAKPLTNLWQPHGKSMATLWQSHWQIYGNPMAVPMAGENKNCTPRPLMRRDAMSLAFRKNRRLVCKKGEPDRRLSVST